MCSLWAIDSESVRGNKKKVSSVNGLQCNATLLPINYGHCDGEKNYLSKSSAFNGCA